MRLSFVHQVITEASLSPVHLNMFELGVWCETKLWSALPALLRRRWWGFFACTCVRAQTQTHIGRCGHTDSFWFKRILEVESTECCSCIPCRKSYFYLGWRCFAGFLVLCFPHHWRYRQEAKKEKRQFLLWQKPNWNAKWDSDDTCEERYWNQMFTQKDTFKSLFRNGTRADMRLNWRCNFNPLLLFREPLTWLLIFD